MAMSEERLEEITARCRWRRDHYISPGIAQLGDLEETAAEIRRQRDEIEGLRGQVKELEAMLPAPDVLARMRAFAAADHQPLATEIEMAMTHMAIDVIDDYASGELTDDAKVLLKAAQGLVQPEAEK